MLQTTITIFQAVDDVIDYSAYCIQRTTVCRREIDMVIVVKMLIQLFIIYIRKGWIAVKVQFLLMVAEDEEFQEFLSLFIVILHLNFQHLSVLWFRFCLDIEHQFLHAFKRPFRIMIYSNAEIVSKEKEEFVIVEIIANKFIEV